MSIKPSSQKRLLQLSCINCDILNHSNHIKDTTYYLNSEHTEIVYISKQKEDLKTEMVQRRENLQKIRHEFNLDAIYQVRN